MLTRTADISRGVTLEYVEHGDPAGLPIILLHGVTDSWRSFEPVLPHLPATFRALALTQRGHGGSSHPPEGYRFADFSADVRAFMDALALSRAVIVGHSMGSYVAQRFAIDHPERTLGLLLAGAFPRLVGNAVVQELWQSGVATMADPIDPVFVREFQEGTVATSVPPDFMDMVVAESLRVPANVWRATFAEFLATDFSNEARQIQAPTLIVWGDRDNIVSRSDQAALQGLIEGARLVVYEGAGHAVHWDEPARFAADLVNFAGSLSAA